MTEDGLGVPSHVVEAAGLDDPSGCDGADPDAKGAGCRKRRARVLGVAVGSLGEGLRMRRDSASP